LFYARVLNSWANSLQLGEYDENKKDAINRRNGQGPKYLKFFLLVFLIWRPKPKPKKAKPRRPSPSHDGQDQALNK